MTSLELNAPAKINLFLEVTGTLQNGYHTVETSMHTVDLCDTVVLTLTDPSDGITLSCSDLSLPCGEDNLVCRAAKRFSEAYGVRRGVHIDLIKRIPAGGGLGGGSADAGAVLRGLNRLCGTDVPLTELAALGARLGADIPFCVTCGSCRAGGIGDLLTPSAPLPGCTVVIVRGRTPISTPEAFARLDRADRAVRKENPIPALLDMGDLAAIASHLYNAFEIISPACREAKELLCTHGALGALMSGSGSAVYGIFAPGTDPAEACDALARCGYTAFVSQPI